jgi:Ran-binding protein 9/10
MSWFRPPKPKSADVPPAWTPAVQQSHIFGLYNEATDDDFESAERFCSQHPLEAPRLLSSDLVERIEAEGCRMWNIDVPRTPRFVGRVVVGGEKGKQAVSKVETGKKCRDSCLFSNLPLIAGLYEVQGKTGIYYEVMVKKMDGIVAIGTSCAD